VARAHSSHYWRRPEAPGLAGDPGPMPGPQREPEPAELSNQRAQPPRPARACRWGSLACARAFAGAEVA
jgi:hypothetical protein